MTDATCQNCRYWCNNPSAVIPAGGKPAGECRRNAPRLVLAAAPGALREFIDSLEDGGVDAAVRLFPRTYPFDWCGEHQPRKDAK